MLHSPAWRPWLLALSFVCAALNMLVAGSLYAYALYSTSFTHHLGYSQKQTSVIGALGDFGLYSTGPLAGWIADSLGPKTGSMIGSILLGFGYSLLSGGYTTGLDLIREGQEPTHYLVMATFLFTAAVGCSTSYMSAYSCLMKNFSQARGVALGIPVSMFGLSAAFFTLIAQAFFLQDTLSPLEWTATFVAEKELNTAKFLLFMGLASGLVNFLAVFGLNIVPPPSATVGLDGDVESIQEPTQQQQQQQQQQQATVAPTENTPLLSEIRTQGTNFSSSTLVVTSAQRPTASNNELEQVDDQEEEENVFTKSSVIKNEDEQQGEEISVSGWEFFTDKDAQSYFLIIFCLAGSGLMIINSVSSILDFVSAGEFGAPNPQQVYRDPTTGRDPIAPIVAAHVALISVASYSGRIASGLGSDFAIAQYGMQRIYVLPLATACMALAQLVGIFASLKWLYLCSALTGLAYGGFFGVAGTIVAETWGTKTCGQNWGWLSLGSAFGGSLFNIIFGLVVDSHHKIGSEDGKVCKGHGCFRGALYISFSACIFAVGLSLSMCYRRREEAAAAKLKLEAEASLLSEARDSSVATISTVTGATLE